jgi:cyclase
MLKHRLIPVLLLKNGALVRSSRFSFHQVIGDPVNKVERFNEWSVDELIYLDISREAVYDRSRSDIRVEQLSDPLAILRRVSKTCFMPLTWGGRLRTVDDMRACFQHGADKVTLNSQAVRTPELIAQGSKAFGSQAVVVSIDVKRIDGAYRVFIDCGGADSGREALDWAREAESRGAGEILLQEIDRDGMATGYGLDLIHDFSSAVSIPVIACSGVGRYEDFAKGIEAGASAVAAANIFHFKELSDRNAKRAMSQAQCNVRLSNIPRRSL